MNFLFVFPNLKTLLKGQRFEDVNMTVQNTTEDLKAIHLKKKQRYIEKWQDRQDYCIDAKVQRFESCLIACDSNI